MALFWSGSRASFDSPFVPPIAMVPLIFGRKWMPLGLVIILSLCMAASAASESQAIYAIRNHWEGLLRSWPSFSDPCDLRGVTCEKGAVVGIEAKAWWGNETSVPLLYDDLRGLSALTSLTLTSTVSFSNPALVAFLNISTVSVLSIQNATGMTSFPRRPWQSKLFSLTLSDMPDLTQISHNAFNASQSLRQLTLSNVGVAQLPPLFTYVTISITLVNLPLLEEIPDDWFKDVYRVEELNFTALPRITQLPSSLATVRGYLGFNSGASLYLSRLPITSVPQLMSGEFMSIIFRDVPYLTSIPWMCNWATRVNGLFQVSNTSLDSATITCIVGISSISTLKFSPNTTAPYYMSAWNINLKYLELPLSWTEKHIPYSVLSLRDLSFLKLVCPSAIPTDSSNPRTLDSLSYLLDVPFLKTFDTSYCGLVGTISASFLTKSSMRQLGLRYNLLSGTLPRTTSYIQLQAWLLDHNRLVLCPYSPRFPSTTECTVSFNLAPCNCFYKTYSYCYDSGCPGYTLLPFTVTPSSTLPSKPLPSCPSNQYISQEYAIVSASTTLSCNVALDNLILDLPPGFESAPASPLSLSGCLVLKNELVVRLPFAYVNAMWNDLMTTGANKRFLPLITQPTFCGLYLNQSDLTTFSFSLVYPSGCANLRASPPTFNFNTGVIGTYITIQRECSADRSYRISAIVGSIVAVACPLTLLVILIKRAKRMAPLPTVPTEVLPLLQTT